ncbi:MAG: alpha/beta hydrolase [Acidobacteria bacterium]|nr:alpha/beta hydrolase [Acidobacteriota bacterium]
MATAVVDGIRTRYEVIGSGPPLLMFSPGGFDATLDKWSTQGVYARIKPVQHLSHDYSCIIFDRRETGESGGRIEPISWAHYVAQAKGLVDHLKIERAHIVGACMGCCPAVAFAVAHPHMTLSLLLYWPVGGAKYRINSRLRFAQHLVFVHQHGLRDVVELARRDGRSFGEDPRGGPWVSVIRRDQVFADEYARQDVNQYKLIVTGMEQNLFDRDTAPGAEPEDLMRLEVPALIVPGRDQTHATSAARYLEECLPKAEYWDVAVDAQTEQTVPPRMLEFLGGAAARA